MEELIKPLQALAIFFILSTITSRDGGSARAKSLWGKKVDFMQKDCGYWLLRPEYSIPSLDQFSVCVNIKRKINNSEWTAFMYLNPNKTETVLAVRGHGSELNILMFGRVWYTSPVVTLGNWHSICVTWSGLMLAPNVYVNGTVMSLTFKSEDPMYPNCCRLAPNGTLTLAVAHHFVKDMMVFEKGTELKGSLSLFRLWGTVRTQQQILDLACIDGNILHWEARIWDKGQDCVPVQDLALQCDWTFYEVEVTIIILRKDGNKTNDYDARDISHQWLGAVLPSHISLHKVSVSALSSNKRSSRNAEQGTKHLWSTHPGISQFVCKAILNVFPDADVGKMQDEVLGILEMPYSNEYCYLNTDPDFIFIYPLEDLWPDTSSAVTGQTTTFQAPSTTDSVTTERTTATSPMMKTTVTESYSTSKEASTTVLISTTSIKTTFTASPMTTEETSVSSISTMSSSYITTTAPYTETTLADSSTTIAEVLSSTTSQILTVTPCPLLISTVGAKSDSFFKVALTVNITGFNYNPEKIIQSWLNKSFSCEDISVLNFKLSSTRTHEQPKSVEEYTKSSRAVEEHFPFSVTSCTFQTKVTTSLNNEETKEQIQKLLDQPYISGAIYLDARPEDILIYPIDPGSCPGHRHHTRQGLFTWPETAAERTAEHSCRGNPGKKAYRKCMLDAVSNKALWRTPDLMLCHVVVNSMSDLEDITITADNAEDILIMIEDILHENTVLNELEIETVLKKLSDVINVSVITQQLGEVIINITSDILESESNLLPFTNSILNITEAVGDQMFGFTGQSSSLVAPALAISVVNIDPTNFHNLTFGVSSTNKGSYTEIYINKDPFDGTVAFILLPSVIQENFPILNHTSPRIQFQFYGVPTLFQTKGDAEGKQLNTYVVSASVTNSTGTIQNLKEYVVVTLHHLKAKTHDQDVQCVYWDFNKNDGYGGWNPNGCWTYNVSKDYTTCLCDHLTHFGVLLDVSRTPIDEKNEKILTLITYMGCGVSSCFLGITVLTYSLLEKLRRDYPSKILLNLCLALLGLNMIFLLNSWISSFGIYGLCIAVAMTLHYFLLSSFTWMGLGAVNMYLALVKVFNVYVPSYILKFCFLGWGIPLIICGLILAVKRDAYGMITSSDSQMTLDDSDMFCWVQNDIVFYVSVVSYIALILLCNSAIFLVVLIQIRNMQVNQPAGTRSGLSKDLRAVASLTFLLGLTWALAFLAWGPVKVFLLYLFAILNSLQGFFIFVFHCLMKENVRKQWRVHLCCGVFKLQDYSEWTQTAMEVTKPKPTPPNKFPFIASVRSIKSNSTQSSSVSSEYSQHQASITGPNMDFVYDNSLVIPRARTGLMHPATGSGHDLFPKLTKDGLDIDIYNK
ncbi:adhesion G-protein coupled receptor G4 [Triplophysa dalaica]|uniref:adhesion G-protein coupled receptor G4 n=1 Tax=Triplophysa dalaica TaxID=1582913 RepID=UPI0024DFFE74|nr:adhesion G-protein coupled receptor G4 [Triplophysa dalaica]